MPYTEIVAAIVLMGWVYYQGYKRGLRDGKEQGRYSALNHIGLHNRRDDWLK